MFNCNIMEYNWIKIVIYHAFVVSYNSHLCSWHLSVRVILICPLYCRRQHYTSGHHIFCLYAWLREQIKYNRVSGQHAFDAMKNVMHRKKVEWDKKQLEHTDSRSALGSLRGMQTLGTPACAYRDCVSTTKSRSRQAVQTLQNSVSALNLHRLSWSPSPYGNSLKYLQAWGCF